PIGFTINLAALASLTFEGRFLLGLAPHLSFVALPSFQKTIDLPFYDFKAKTFVDAFGITRANLGLGLRGHFYEYDSWDGFYVEGMSRFGMTWAGDDPFMWAITPSLILGYQWVYLSGYTVSFGVGIEWELLLGRPPGRHSQILKTNYWNISKIPPTAEWSIGWTW
ncbi:MAG TPA: hypothetical protein VEL47_04465, partial [Myxococcota bacterium]|nr:hypothetical protein [Myxococcota bacterium]